MSAITHPGWNKIESRGSQPTALDRALHKSAASTERVVMVYRAALRNQDVAAKLCKELSVPSPFMRISP